MLYMDQFWLLISVLTLAVPHLFISGVISAGTFTILNNCAYTVWPATLSNAGVAPLSTNGFALQTGESYTINAPSNWGGRIWGRTLCTNNSAGQFTCLTGDCGTGQIDCSGNYATPPATLAEFTLDGSGGLDFYDVSFVDGSNLAILVVPEGGTGGNCSTTGCSVDLNGSCPSELQVTSADGDCVACKSACDAFGQAQYCCSGAFGSPNTCQPSAYSEFFKNACPLAYSYAYDDRTSTFTCAGANYLVTFCPSPNASQKASSDGQNPVVSPVINSTMLYDGLLGFSGASSPSTCTHVFRSPAIGGAVAIVAAIWWLGQLF